MATASTDVDHRGRMFRVVLLTTLVLPFGVPLISPALPSLRDALGLTDVSASLIVSAYFVTGFLLAPALGALVDRAGRRRFLLWCLLGFGTMGTVIALGPPYSALLGMRLLQGTAAAGLFVVTITLIGDTFEGTARNRAFGRNAAALSLGAAIAPLLGGALVTISWRAPFLVCLSVFPVAWYAHRRLPADRPNDRTAPLDRVRTRVFDRTRASLTLLRRRPSGPLIGSMFVVDFLLFGAIFTALPFLVAAEYAPGPVILGGLITAVAITLGIVAFLHGWLATLARARGLVAGGVLVVGVGLLAMWGATSFLTVTLGAMLVGVGTGLATPAIDAALTNAVTPDRRATAISLRIAGSFLGRATGPLTVVALAGGTPPGYHETLLWLGGLVVLAGGTAMGWFVLHGGWRPAVSSHSR